MSRQIIEEVEKIALPILESYQLELVDVEYTKEGQNWFLRVFIDGRDKAVDIDDCARVSEKLSKELDKQDPITGAYILEVSSPGAERPLKKESDFQKAVGKHIHITTYEPIDGKKAFEGVLKGLNSDTIRIEEKGKVSEIPRSKVAKARLAIVF